MFSNIEQGLQVYKNYLKEHYLKSNEFKKSTKTEGNESPPISSISDKEWEYMLNADARLDGIEQALGLSFSELSAIREEIRQATIPA